MLNPFAYRGYCYDDDMGLYYLQSRYYDPDTGRFINADDTNYLNATGTVLGCNLFAYCENDPVNKTDSTGHFPTVIRYVFSAIKVAKAIYDNFLCVRLYCWGFTHRKYNETYDFSKNWKALLVKRIKNSKAISKYLINYIKNNMKKNNSTTRSVEKNISFYPYITSSISDLDLTLAIGGGGAFDFTITKTNKKKNGKTYYKIKAKLNEEVFNFEYWKMNIGKKQFGVVDPHSSSQLVTIINNTGYFTQSCGAFVPFTWEFTVNYKILY